MSKQKPELTIGMAHFEDYHGVYFTIQSLRLHHAEVMDKVEIVVIDNSPPTSKHSPHVENLVKHFANQGTANTKYIKFRERTGTSAPRDKIFEVATADNVLVSDCHVLYRAGAIKQLIEFYRDNPTSAEGIYSGPLLMDDMWSYSSHFDDFWRGEMWGIWARAWQCCEGGIQFSTHTHPEHQPKNDPHCHYKALGMGNVPVTSCFECGKELPTIPWEGHEMILEGMGFIALGRDPNSEPFDIPGMGLGSFTAKKAGWLGFHPKATGFGGEELYIHEKYRQHGREVKCLPFLQWVHRFTRPEGQSYPLTRYNKVRNYVLEFEELNRPLTEIYDHFVGPNLMTVEEWEHLIKDPEKNATPPQRECNTCPGAKEAASEIANVHSPKEAYEVLLKVQRDLNYHMPKLRELSQNVESVTEVAKRPESLAALLAASPKKLVSYNVEVSSTMTRLHTIAKETSKSSGMEFQSAVVDSPKLETIEETDLLFIDSTAHNKKRLLEELNKFAPKVKRYIAIHDTELHKAKGDDGGPGLLDALIEFMRANPIWKVIYHTREQYGLTVISCDARDKKSLPSSITMASNFVKASAKHVASGAKHASQEMLDQRLAICTLCPQRNGANCSVCGCVLTSKASWKDQTCPLDLWPEELDPSLEIVKEVE